MNYFECGRTFRVIHNNALGHLFLVFVRSIAIDADPETLASAPDMDRVLEQSVRVNVRLDVAAFVLVIESDAPSAAEVAETIFDLTSHREGADDDADFLGCGATDLKPCTRAFGFVLSR
jgi:hypothetical protein